MEQREFIVEAEAAGQRIDRFLSGEDTGLSRSALQGLVAEGHVLCNGRSIAKSLKLKAGDTILLEIPDAKPIEAVPQDIPLDIVYEDDHLLVVNKPKGMVVHPAPGNPDGTLVNALLWHCKGSLSGIGGEIRPGIVHRIDKDTSGLLVVAKDDATHIGLSQQMAVHSVERAYQTVVYGGLCGGQSGPLQDRPQKDGGLPGQRAAHQVCLHRLQGAGALRGLHPAGVPPQDGPHPPDPRPYGVHPAPRGGRPCVWPAQLHHQAPWPVPPRQDTGLHPSHHGGAAPLRFGAAGVFHPLYRIAQEGDCMTKLLDSALVLCDLDHLLLAGDGNMPQVVRDVLQLFSSRGGRLTVFTQRSPRAVRAVLGGVRLAAPALTCGGTLAYRFSEGGGQPLCSFAGCEESIFKKLPAAVGLGIALQMADGSTRVLRMSTALERHLRREFTPFTLCSPADVRGEDVLRILLYQDRQQLPIQALLERALGDNAAMLRSERIGMDVMVLTPGTVSAEAMLGAVCLPINCTADQLTVAAGCGQMLELVRQARQSVVPADAPVELRLAASQTTLTDHDTGAAAEFFYGLVRSAEAAS